MRDNFAMLKALLKLAEERSEGTSMLLITDKDGYTTTRISGSAPELFGLMCELLKRLAVHDPFLESCDYVEVVAETVKKELLEEGE